MAHTHDVYDTGKHFEINGISRFIKETSTTKLVLVQGDHKSEVITFEMPRYIDGHDMLLCNKIRVHYINIETKTNNSSADIYEVTDLKLCEDCGEEEETLLFTWTIEAPATKYFGSLSFLVKFECTEGDNILYQWNTARYVNVNVLNGIDNSEAFVDKYSNVIEEWYNKLVKESEIVTNFVENAGQQFEDCVRITNEANEIVEELRDVKEELSEGGFITGIREKNHGNILGFWVGSIEEYEALENKPLNCYVILTDDHSLAGIRASIEALMIMFNEMHANGPSEINKVLYDNPNATFDDGNYELSVPGLSKYDIIKVVAPDNSIVVMNRVDAGEFIGSKIIRDKWYEDADNDGQGDEPYEEIVIRMYRLKCSENFVYFKGMDAQCDSSAAQFFTMDHAQGKSWMMNWTGWGIKKIIGVI